MIKIGLTGGIGSGKTTVANIFKQLGAPVYFSDDRAKDLMLNNQFLRESLISLLGDKVIIDGVLNRSYIASKVFSNPKELIKLNALVHPFVQKDFDVWSASQNSFYVLKEAAILFETGVPAPCPALVSTRIKIGLFPDCLSCNSEANLKECAGTTRSS